MRLLGKNLEMESWTRAPKERIGVAKCFIRAKRTGAANKTYKQSIVMLIFAKYILNLQC